MNHKDRFYATIHHQQVDRPAAWLGLPVPLAEPALMNYFGVNSIDQLHEVIDDDIYPIEVPYNYPPSDHIVFAFNFAKDSHLDIPDERTLTAPGFFEDYDDPSDVDKFVWPDPARYPDRGESHRRVAAAPADRIKMGILWSAHFQDACAAFGMEKSLMTIYMNPEIFRVVINHIGYSLHVFRKLNSILLDFLKKRSYSYKEFKTTNKNLYT